mgnify:CR=1 FL=1
MSRANQHLRTGLQRLRSGDLAPPLPGSFGQDPRALRPERLRWLKTDAPSALKSLAPAKIAAFPAVLRPIALPPLSTAARAEAPVGAVPPFSDPQFPEGAMR